MRRHDYLALVQDDLVRGCWWIVGYGIGREAAVADAAIKNDRGQPVTRVMTADGAVRRGYVGGHDIDAFLRRWA